MANDKRRTPRYPFDAFAELIEMKSQSQLSTRVTNLGLYGCYFDTIYPFPNGTAILLKIAKGLVFFEAEAEVAFSRPSKGMGVTFRNIHPYFIKVLEEWLTQAKAAAEANVMHFPR